VLDVLIEILGLDSQNRIIPNNISGMRQSAGINKQKKLAPLDTPKLIKIRIHEGRPVPRAKFARNFLSS
jgi:hypothetical protein